MSLKKIFYINSCFCIYMFSFLLVFVTNTTFAFSGTPENMVLVNAGGFTRGIDKKQYKAANIQGEKFKDESPSKMI